MRSTMDPTPLLLSPDLARSEVARLLAPYGFKDWEQVDSNLQLMAGDPQSRTLLVPILRDVLEAASHTADPDQALNAWERYLEASNARGQVFRLLTQAPHLIQLVCVLFGNSPAMADAMIRDPTILSWFEDERILTARPTRKRLSVLLEEGLGHVQTLAHKLESLRRFHRREMLCIGARDLCRVASVQETCQSLSWLAELVIHAVCRLVEEDLQSHHGIPHHTNAKGTLRQTGFVILGMGKLGGRELNYRSDVDLVYLYESSRGQTIVEKKGQTCLSNEIYFHNLARTLTWVLSVSTSEGSLFQVDLRLRPEGTIGPLAWSVHEAVRYYQTRGRTWERFAFLKARPVAGERAVGQTFLRKMRPFVVGQKGTDAQILVKTVCALRQKIHHNLRRKGEYDRHVKLTPGGIRDIEFIVQTLQLLHGVLEPRLFERNTLNSLKRLVASQHLSPDQGETLRRAYLYLRDVEHKLQMVHELQTHTLPDQDSEIMKCAIRLGYEPSTLTRNPSSFLAEYRLITGYVRDLLQDRVLEGLPFLPAFSVHGAQDVPGNCSPS